MYIYVSIDIYVCILRYTCVCLYIYWTMLQAIPYVDTQQTKVVQVMLVDQYRMIFLNFALDKETIAWNLKCDTSIQFHMGSEMRIIILYKA